MTSTRCPLPRLPPQQLELGKDNTVILLDWDDTIFPTTALTAEGHFAVSSVPPLLLREQNERLLRRRGAHGPARGAPSE